MKLKPKIILLLVSFLWCFSLAIAQTKHALLIGIGDYSTTRMGWEKLSSNNDLNYIRKALLKQGFAKEHIRSVIDSVATKAGIIQAINSFTSLVKENDLVMIHVSSHGEQIEDQNGDEIDGLDESIVTYNAIAPAFSKNKMKDQQEYLRDDEFGLLIDKLRKKLGKNGHVMVSLDLCHSGTGTRGEATVRGGKEPFIYSSTRNTLKEKKDNVFKEQGILHGGGNDLATYVVFSAARAEELAYETIDEEYNSIGSLSYAISKAFENLETSYTYRTFFTKIQTIIDIKTPQQHPVMEGDGTERLMFGGKFIEQRTFFEIEGISKKIALVNGGKLAGLDSGARISLYPSGTNDLSAAKRFTTGTIIKASAYNSEVLLDTLISIAPKALWAFIAEPVFNLSPIVLEIESHGNDSLRGFNTQEIKTIKEGVKNFPFIKFYGYPDLLLTKGKEMDTIKLYGSGVVFTTVNRNEYKETLLRYVQYKFFKSIEIKDQSGVLDVSLIPLVNGRADTSLKQVGIQDGYEFKVNDTIVLLIKNFTNTPLYFNVLDLQPDGIINSILPNRKAGIYPSDLKIGVGKTLLLSQYPIRILPPHGNEVFKIFCSKEEINMEEIVVLKAKISRGNLSALEKIVQAGYVKTDRGIETTIVSNSEGSMFNLPFTIVPK